MIFLFTFTVGSVWNALVKVPDYFVMPGVIFAFLLFSYGIRKYVTNFVVYFLLHIIPFAAFIFVPMDAFTRIFLTGFILLFAGLNIKNWFSGNLKEDGFAPIHFGFVFAFAGAYLAMDIFHRRFTMFMIFIFGILFFVLYYVRLFTENVNYLYIEKKRNDKMPLRDMIINSAKLAIPFVIVSVIIMVIARFDFVDKIALDIYFKIAGLIGIIIKKTLEFLEFIFSKIFSDEMVEIEPLVLPQEEEMGGNSVVVNVIAVITYIFIVGLLVFLGIKMIISIYKAIVFNRQKKVYKVEDDAVIEIRENIVQRRKSRRVKLSKIRKMYKKLIEKKAKEGYQIYRFHTPRERSEDIKKKMNADVSFINEIYEKERYGQFND